MKGAMTLGALGLIIAALCAGVDSTLAADVGVSQGVASTTTSGTTDLTVSGFGTPKCALYVTGLGTANGTVVDHGMMAVGFHDGSSQRSRGFVSADAQATSAAGSVVDTDSALVTMATATQTKDGDGTASWITNGTRLTWGTAPPSAYRTEAMLFGGSGIQSCVVGTATTNATDGGTTVVTGLGFTFDVLLLISSNNNASNATPSFGIVWNNGGSIVQRVVSFHDQGGAANMSTSSYFGNTRVLSGPPGGARAELTAISSVGFTLTTRDAGGARDVAYLALKLNGISAWLGTVVTPTGTGNQSVTGVGFRPQGGLILTSENTTANVENSTDDGEVFGLSMFDVSAAYSTSIFSEDGDADSNTESVTDNRLCRTRKDAANHLTCTLVSRDADGLTRNFTVTSGVNNLQAMLLFSDPISGTFMMRRRVQP